MKNYEYYCKFGGDYITKFFERNPEFDTDEFKQWLSSRNRADRDSGEFQDIAKHEVLRCAAEFEEKKWRLPNCYGDSIE